MAQRQAEVKKLKIAIETLRPIVYKTVGLRGSEAPGRRQQEGLLPTVQVSSVAGGGGFKMLMVCSTTQLILDESGNVVLDQASLSVTATAGSQSAALRDEEAGVAHKV